MDFKLDRRRFDRDGAGFEIQDFPWGRFVFFADPDGNKWAVQQIPNYGQGASEPEGL